MTGLPVDSDAEGSILGCTGAAASPCSLLSPPEDQPMRQTPIEPWRWRVIWLMFLATMLNYMDRQALGATSEFVKNEFHLDEEGYGWLEFWFGIAYGLFQ